MHRKLKGYTARSFSIMMYRFRKRCMKKYIADKAIDGSFGHSPNQEEQTKRRRISLRNKSKQETEVENNKNSLKKDEKDKLNSLEIINEKHAIHNETKIGSAESICDVLSESTDKSLSEQADMSLSEQTDMSLSEQTDMSLSEQTDMPLSGQTDKSIVHANIASFISQPAESDSFLGFPALKKSSIEEVAPPNKSNEMAVIRLLKCELQTLKNDIYRAVKGISSIQTETNQVNNYISRILEKSNKKYENKEKECEMMKNTINEMNNGFINETNEIRQTYLQFINEIKREISAMDLLFKSDRIKDAENKMNEIIAGLTDEVSETQSKLIRLGMDMVELQNENELLKKTKQEKDMEIKTGEEALLCMTKCYEKEKEFKASVLQDISSTCDEFSRINQMIGEMARNTTNLKITYKNSLNYLSNMIIEIFNEQSLIKNEIQGITNIINLKIQDISGSFKMLFDDVINNMENKEIELKATFKRNIELEAELENEKNERNNDRLALVTALESVKEAKDELNLKASYILEIERHLEETMKSNTFYEEQLIASDNVIKELREKQSKSGVDINMEMNKIRQKYFKENAMLKLRIEELEMKINDKV